MICRTEATALRIAPFSETSRVVTWLTPDHGRMATLIKGSQRPKSSFLGQYDLFYTCELLYYRRDFGGAHITRECSPMRAREALRRDWKAAAAASYFCDLAARVSVAESPQPELFDLLAQGLDGLAGEGAQAGFVHWFELRLLETLGLAPRLDVCVACARPLDVQARAMRLAAPRGGLLCADCAPPEPDQETWISPDVLATLRAWQRSKSARAARTTALSNLQAGAIQRCLGRFLDYHLDTPLVSRGIALNLIARRRAVQKTLERQSGNRFS